MLKIRKADERGFAELDWLKTWHTFSFADYHDPEHMHYGPLRVMNDDCIAPGGGFPMHPHRDMEIVTYMLEGALEHKDSMGNGSVIRAGEVQRMTAGTGVFHSEFNPSESEAARLLQIWIMPDRGGHTPGYEQIMIPEPDKRGRLRLIASSDGREGSVTINQALDLYAALLDGDETIDFDIGLRQKAWLQLAQGSVSLNGMKLQPGDGVAVEDEPVLSLSGGKRAEVLLFVMPRTA